MYNHLVRFFTIVLMLAVIVGCSHGRGNPTAPAVDPTGGPDQAVDTGSESTLTPGIEIDDPVERILGNFHYYSDDRELLAWGTVFVKNGEWDYRLDYVAPRIRALRQSDVTREAQAVIDLSWLKLIKVGVSYIDQPTPFPPAKYHAGDFMQYRVDIQNKVQINFEHATVVAAQVDMFDNLLNDDARDIFEEVTIPKTGQSLFGDWTIEPTLDNGFYYTRVRAGFEVYGGWLVIVVFDAKAGVWKIEGGPQLFDPVAKGVTTTPVVTVGENVHVQDNGSYDPDGGSITLYEWDLNDDGTFDTTGPSADTSFVNPGVYYINLRVTDDEGATDDLTDDPGDTKIEITVNPPPVPPVAVATADKYSAYTGELISFDGTQSYDPDGGDIVLYEWDWDNDGIFDQIGATPDHYYITSGVYHVQLRVTDDELQTDLLDTPLEITITEEPIVPIACFTWDPEFPVVCQQITFDGTCSTDDDGQIVLYQWDFDNDGEVDFESADQLAYWTYFETGDYTVTLVVTDETGLTDDEVQQVTVSNAQPTAVLTVDKTEAYVGEDITFSACDSHDNDCDGQEITLFHFYRDKDDTTFEESQTCSIVLNYSAPGYYYADVEVYDDETGSDRLDADTWPIIHILPAVQAPIAFADADPLSQTVCADIHFFDDGSYDPDGGSITLYEWDWDNDGIFDENGIEAWHSWTIPGTYYIQFRVTDDEGATDTLDLPIEVSITNALPVAAATADKYFANVDEAILFDGTTSYDGDCDGAEIVAWEWDWNNDGIFDDTGSSKSHSYSETGVYYVQLRVTDDEGATDTLDLPLEITVTFDYFDPIALASSSTTNSMVCYSILFKDDGSYDPDGGAIQLYEWDWDNDGTFDESGTPIYHTFTDPGIHFVQFRVTDDEGATDTLDTPLQISIEHALPTADASADNYTPWTGTQVNFDGSTSYDNDCDGMEIVLWEWDWENDGTFDDTGEFSSHIYNSPGQYEVQLRVTDDEGGTDLLDLPLLITVEIAYFDPIAYATSSTDASTVCYSILFSDDGSYDPDGGNIQLYEWDWNNDGTFDEMGTPVYHSFDTVGTHYVQFRVTDDEGATDTLDLPLEILIENSLPTAGATADKYSANVDEVINFDGSSSIDNDCNGMEIVSWEWDWENDGIYDDIGVTKSHAYTEAGVYSVQLRVTDDEGGTDTLDFPLQITVSNLFMDPIADASADPNPQIVCLNVELDGSTSYDPDGGSIVTYEWDLGADGTYDLSGAIVYYSWDTPGNYNVQLRVTDDEGATDLLDLPLVVMIEDALPTAVATADKYNAYVNDVISFDGSGSYDNDCSGMEIVMWEWDWENDGIYEGSGEFPTHSYSAPGDYYVQLRVTDDEGSVDTLDLPLHIVITTQTFDPIAAATADPNPQIVCLNVGLDGTTSYDPDGGSIVSWEWDLGADGTYELSGSLVYNAWTTPGNYNVQLRVTDDEGATDLLDTPLVVMIENSLPTAGATADKTSVYVDEVINFDGSTSHDNDCNGEIVQWEWDWENDGIFEGSGQFPTHSYPAPGDYYVQLRVTDDEGGTDTLDTPLHIVVSTQYFDPIADASADPNPQIVCLNVELDGTTSYDPDGGSIVSWEWDLGADGTYDLTGSIVNYAWNTPGNYSVQLRVTDDEGATDLLDTPLSIIVNNALPTSVASADKYTAYVDEVINFDGSGSYDNDCSGSITQWEWDWDNDGTYEGSGQYPTHAYGTTGDYYVQLRVTDDEGSTDTLDTPLHIVVSTQYFDPIAYAALAAGPHYVCTQVHLYDDGSYDPDGGIIALYEWDLDVDGSYEYTGTDIYPSWDTPGTYYVQLRVTDDEGATDLLDTPLQIVVQNVLPTAVASADKYSVYEGELINFDGTGSYDNDCNGSITLWEWDWENDGTFDTTGSTSSHSYPVQGTYYVQLRVTDDEGGTDMLDTPLQIQVSVQALPPIAYADFSPNHQIVCEDVHIFDDGSYDPDGGVIVSWQWDIGADGTYEYFTEEIYHAFDTPGIYNVQLLVTDDEGATDLLDTALQITIDNALPTAAAAASKYVAAIDDLIDFDGSASTDNDCLGDSITLWEWDWTNDGTYDDTGEFKTHSYTTPGLYEVMLRVTDNEGATDTLDTPLEILVNLTGCAEGIHSYSTGAPGSDRGISPGYSMFTFSVLPRTDIAYIESGDLAGYGLVQGGPNSLVRFDPDVDTDDPINDGVYSIKTGGIGPAVLVSSLDAAPYPNIVATVVSDRPDVIRLIDPTVTAGSNKKYSASFGSGSKIMAVDFEEDGSICVVVQYDFSVAYPIYLWRAAFVGAPDYYTTWTATGIGIEIGEETDVFDIAVNWTNQTLYLFDSGMYSTGRVTLYDLSAPGVPGLLTQYDELFPAKIDFVSSFDYGVATFADIEIDHMGNDENCHILLYARMTSTSAELRKFNENLELVSSYQYSGAVPPSFTINPEINVTDRDMMLPGQAKLGFWMAPSDW